MKKVLFLHHSTGKCIWLGKTNRYVYKLTGKGDVSKYFRDYNRKNGTDIQIEESIFPKKLPYGWKNYPYDYYNIWVKNAGDKPFLEEPTLEILTKKYDVIIFKHCYPVSRILEDTGAPDIDSDIRRLENYKLQYNALKRKMYKFPENKFIVWTPAVMTGKQLHEDEARRTLEFYRWIKEEWDEKGDNIFIWDFYNYETDGGLYLSEKNAEGASNSHPNKEFAAKVSPLFSKFVIDVVNGVAE
jgi:hypothetical protein